MDESRIGELHLRVRAEGDEQVLREQAERFARRVLERAVELLEARAPGRLIFIGRLPLSWVVEEEALAEPGAPGLTDRLARELADQIDTRLPAGNSLVAGEGDVVVFDDEATWRAAHLLARARGETASCYASLEEEGDPVLALARPGRSRLSEAVLMRLEGAGVLVEVLAALPEERLAHLAATLGAVSGRAAVVGSPGGGRVGSAASTGASEAPSEPTAAAAGISEDRQVVERLVSFGSALPRRLGLAARHLALMVRAVSLLGGTAPASRRGAAVTAAAVTLGLASLPALTALAADRGESRSDGVAPAVAAEPALVLVPGPGEALGPVLVTRFGGVFYLLSKILELGIAEALWVACLAEGAVLARAVAALLGGDSAADPAPALFGGVEPEGTLAVALAQQEEVARTTLAALAQALPRRALAALPELHLSLVDDHTGRLLIATPAGSPFVVFAWPAATREQLEAGIAALDAGWPDSAPPPCAPAALAQLDRRARIRATRAHAPRPFIPYTDDAPTTALLAQVIGAPCLLFSARAALAPGTAADLVASHFAHPARAILGRESMTIVLPIARTDLALRLAGLDKDPGWIPWLRRKVRFVFEGNALE
ncbi:MAG TPA: hypothetical protein VH877_22345 [Polyangia bacterium]|jgi:hypothetical protein|nr:hypothetical protein [Polyangia bacterium]